MSFSNIIRYFLILAMSFQVLLIFVDIRALNPSANTDLTEIISLTNPFSIHADLIRLIHMQEMDYRLNKMVSEVLVSKYYYVDNTFICLNLIQSEIFLTIIAIASICVWEKKSYFSCIWLDVYS